MDPCDKGGDPPFHVTKLLVRAPGKVDSCFEVLVIRHLCGPILEIRSKVINHRIGCRLYPSQPFSKPKNKRRFFCLFSHFLFAHRATPISSGGTNDQYDDRNRLSEDLVKEKNNSTLSREIAQRYVL